MSHRPPVYRAYLRVPLSMGTGPYVLWIRTCRFPSPPPSHRPGPLLSPIPFFLRSFLFHPYRPPHSLSLSLSPFPLSLLHQLRTPRFVSNVANSIHLLATPLPMPLCLTPLPSTINLAVPVYERALFPLSRQLCLIDGPRGGSAGGNGRKWIAEILLGSSLARVTTLLFR